MKKILIAGANSYIGTSLEEWISHWPDDYKVYTVDTQNCSWKEQNFSEYDVVLNVAGIVHKKDAKQNADVYYKVNRDLAAELAEKSKLSGVRQFIQMSTMAIYGIKSGEINRDTLPCPKTDYGKSKLEAEEIVRRLDDRTFRVAILRAPMVYGKGCKGNYSTLSKFSKKMPVFPNIRNQRSMIYVGNLSYFLKKLIDNEMSGVFFPQNSEYVCTSEMVRLIGEAHHRKIRLTNAFNPFLHIVKAGFFAKVFGDLFFKKEDRPMDCCDMYSFRESIQITEEEAL